MTPNRWKSWRAQEPSPSFTESTVQALLRDRRRRRALGGRRWAVVGAMAAVLVGGAAWGLGGFSLPPHRHPAPPEPAKVELPSPPPAPTIVRVPPPEPSSSAPPTPSVTRRKAEAPTPGRRVVLPRCFCSPKEAICDCF